MFKNIIFISIDGLTDQLGQSQILPYLTGLSKVGYHITIVSSEKAHNFETNKNNVEKITNLHNIKWEYCQYKSGIPFFSQRNNLSQLKKTANEIIKGLNGKVIIHSRNLMVATIGYKLQKKYKTKLIFDTRGFWADERIDGNIWKLQNPIHNFLYNYFKRKEIELIENADYVVTLTNNAKNEIKSWKLKNIPNIEVIPCCADMEHFIIQTNDVKIQQRKNLNIPENSFVIGYLGSLGTWYMLDEMLDFFNELLKKKPNSIFFFITNDDEKGIIKAAEEKGIAASSLRIKSAKRNEVPLYISSLDIGLFFIKPLYSKKGSSPTKLAELLACGVPIITNSGVGDVDELIVNTNCGVLISSFNTEEYQQGINKINNLNTSKQYYRDIALANFSLEKAVNSYKKIYDNLSH
jgi:glycosyltransferase involved in cell wall biosynthesis